ncbi:MAG: hypothetical protein LBD91_08455 [Prevotellaceae bacterium]|nr:hypothetical protein [Prevotellaceae bacterium]
MNKVRDLSYVIDEIKKNEDSQYNYNIEDNELIDWVYEQYNYHRNIAYPFHQKEAAYYLNPGWELTAHEKGVRAGWMAGGLVDDMEGEAEAIENLYQKMVQFIQKKEANNELPESVVVNNTAADTASAGGSSLWTGLALLAGVALLVWFIVKRKKK